MPAGQGAGLRPLPGRGRAPGREPSPFYRLLSQVMRDTAGETQSGGRGAPICLQHHQGRRVCRFDQLKSLSAEAGLLTTETTLINGVLTVRAPKAEASRSGEVKAAVG